VRKKNAFTLIELLTVIAVISVLIGLLLPALAGAREAAKAVKCMSNLRQCALGLQLYANDFGNVYPVHVTTNSSSEKTWIQHLVGGQDIQFNNTGKQYISRGASLCPSNIFAGVDAERSITNGTDVGYGMYQGHSINPFQYEVTFTANGNTRKVVLQRPGRTTSWPGLKPCPSSEVIMLADSLSMGVSVFEKGHMYGNFKDNSSADYSGRIHVIHNRGKRFNAAFYDGHCESVTPMQACTAFPISLKYFYDLNGNFFNY